MTSKNLAQIWNNISKWKRNWKSPILDEKLEMVCDKGDIYHCQYLKSNQGNLEEVLNNLKNKCSLSFKEELTQDLLVSEDECEDLL